MTVVHDIDRPDVAGKAPKMQAIADAAREVLTAPYVTVRTDDNLCSSVCIRGSLEAKEDWANGIYHNSPYFILFISPPKGARYYDPENPQVSVELSSGNTDKKFRKYTATPEKVIAKIQSWIESH